MDLTSGIKCKPPGIVTSCPENDSLHAKSELVFLHVQLVLFALHVCCLQYLISLLQSACACAFQQLFCPTADGSVGGPSRVDCTTNAEEAKITRKEKKAQRRQNEEKNESRPRQ